MGIQNKIIFNSEIITNIITNIIRMVPGISKKKDSFSIKVSEDSKTIDVTFKPLESIISVYNICVKLQQNIYIQLTKQFDLQSKSFNINITAN
ncbi:MAG: hypothetical protein LBM76_01895 [Mycoplasmataceae bacterium]|jgi:hypothetical protein|nr:hypothetical protein [Mycoplasmataceae bacterium]